MNEMQSVTRGAVMAKKKNNESYSEEDFSELFKPIYDLLGVRSSLTAAEQLGLFQSVFIESVSRGIISDRIYVALAKHGIDIRPLLPEKSSEMLFLETMARLLNVRENEKDIAEALGVRVEDIDQCKFGRITDHICVALAKKGHDIRQFWPNPDPVD